MWCSLGPTHMRAVRFRLDTSIDPLQASLCKETSRKGSMLTCGNSCNIAHQHQQHVIVVTCDAFVERAV